jgi:hypothetical protein
MISTAFVLWVLAGASLKVVQKLSRAPPFSHTNQHGGASPPNTDSLNRKDEWLVKQGAQAPCSLFAFVITLIALSNLSLVV